jgi:predicted dehydrogenase
MREAWQRIRDGAIGDIVALQANDYRGGIWVKPREPGQTDMEYQMRNWYYYTWLSGDFNVEQHVHMLDLCSWMKGDYPSRAIGTGGRQARTAPEYGHIYDHFYITYDYADGARLFGVCRQQEGCRNEIGAVVIGTKGTMNLSTRGISMTPTGSAQPSWKYEGPDNVEIVAEHEALYRSVRESNAINNGEYLAKSSLLAILGRMAGYTGQVITWEMAMNSKEDLSPPAYDWNVRLPEPPVAVPGRTRFI